jgi:hypothetical protein
MLRNANKEVVRGTGATVASVPQVARVSAHRMIRPNVHNWTTQVVTMGTEEPVACCEIGHDTRAVTE